MALFNIFKSNIFYFIRDLETINRFTDFYKKGYSLSSISDYINYLKEKELIIQIDYPFNKKEKQIVFTDKGKKLLKLIKEIDLMLIANKVRN